MDQALVCWIGQTDLRAATGDAAAKDGPIAQAVAARTFRQIHLLCDWSREKGEMFDAWLRARGSPPTELHLVRLSGPTEFAEIYEAAVRVATGVQAAFSQPGQLVFHLSPGTPAMAAVWIILGKTRFAAELIESSAQQGVRTAAVPFEISADFVPGPHFQPDHDLERLVAGLPPAAPEFDAIVHRCRAMKRLVAMARRVAPRSVPVLIEGESGTGKELFARAIHTASPRRGKFIAVNCGAIPENLVESELFGHEKGAFTGATGPRPGHFEEASGGTLFLDELGELPLAAQVKLLRVIQEGEVVRVGGSKPTHVNVRLITATNRNLLAEAAAGRFRLDLFYRIAVAILHLPPLRERENEIELLVDCLMEQVNHESAGEPGYQPKKLSAAAKNLLRAHPWPGNVRELLNTLRRAALWSDGAVVQSRDVRAALLPRPDGPPDGILHRPLGGDFDLRQVLAEVTRHYLERALSETGGKKIEASRLLGLPNYQTFTNWLKKHGLDD